MNDDSAYRALLIEDNPGDVRLVREMLAEEPRIPLALENARSLGDALKRLEQERFDAVVVDLGLPDSRGLDTFLRLQTAAPDVAALVLTGSDDVELAMEAVRAGAQDYLVKSQISGGPLVRAVQYAIERKRSQLAVIRATRLYAVLSLVNEAVVRTRTVPELYEAVCRIAVETGKLKMASIGVVDAESHEVKPVAYSGVDDGYLESALISTDETERGMGPTACAIREGRPQISNDWQRDPRMDPWRAAGSARGYRSSAAFPMKVDGRVTGALTLYAGEPDFFTSDEIELLETLTNDVAFALDAFESEQRRRAAEASLRQLNAELEERVQQRTEALVAANREMEAFTYSVSHDLRAPLRAIEGFSTLLGEADDGKLGPESSDCLQRIRKATVRMSELIDALLSLSRIGRQELHLVDADLTAIGRAIAAELRESDRARCVDFVIPDGIRGRADEALIRVVLQNLLSNAWKFTSRQAHARIVFAAGPVGVYFVRDDGVGFDPQFAGKLFVPFQRLHDASEFEGTGIGLATVQRVIIRHGGRVWAEGQPGRGATFFFTLRGAGSASR